METLVWALQLVGVLCCGIGLATAVITEKRQPENPTRALTAALIGLVTMLALLSAAAVVALHA